jgi:hypothetical protein
MYFTRILDVDFILPCVVLNKGQGLAEGLELIELLEESNGIF